MCAFLHFDFGTFTYSKCFFEVKKNQLEILYLQSVGHFSVQIVLSRGPGDSGYILLVP